MSGTPQAIFEEYTGISVKDLLHGSQKRRYDAFRALQSADLYGLERLFLTKERTQDKPVYESSELVPRMWPNPVIEREEFMVSYVTHPRDVCRALLYAHRVEIANPLLEAFYDCLRPETLYERPLPWAIGEALWILDTLRPLLDAGIVSIGCRAVREPGEDLDTQADILIDMALNSARGRAALIQLIPYLKEAAMELMLGSEPRNNIGWRRLVDPVGSDDAPEKATLDRIKALKAGLLYQLKFSFAPHYPVSVYYGQFKKKLVELLSSVTASHADLWLPDRDYVEFITSACESRVQADPALTWTTGLTMADIHDLDINDLIAIRLNSEVFEGWRNALRQAYQELERRAALGTLEEAGKDAAEVLRGGAEQVISRLRQDSRSQWQGGLRSLVVGLAAAAPGAVVGGSEAGVVTGIAGAAIGTAGGVIWQLLDSQKKRRPAAALTRHIAALGPVIERRGS